MLARFSLRVIRSLLLLLSKVRCQCRLLLIKLRLRPKKKSSGKKSHKDSPKTLKDQIEDFKEEWSYLNDWQKRCFVKWYQDEIAKLLEEMEGLAGMAEEETEVQTNLS